MKAVVYDRYGPPEVLRLSERPTPTPSRNDVLVRVRAVEVTKADCELRAFRFPVKWFWLPMRLAWGLSRPRAGRRVLGGYFSGEVEAVGSEVRTVRPGDAVYGSAGIRMGAYAEFLCVPASGCLGHKPSGMSFEESAAVPLGGLNALHFMRLAAIREGERVLVNGAGGSIGTFAVQIARDMGAHVTAVDAAHKEAMLRRIGADDFHDFSRRPFWTTGATYDVILDMVARSPFAPAVGVLNPKGRYLTANPRLSDMVNSVRTTRFTDRTARFAFAAESPDELATLTRMIEEGRLRATVDRVYPLEQIQEAHRRVETEQRQGSVVVSVGQGP